MSIRSFRFERDGRLYVDGRPVSIEVGDGSKIEPALNHFEVALLIQAARAFAAEQYVEGRNVSAAEYRETLRDKFAMAALAAIAFDGLPDGGGCTIESYDPEGIARQAYKIADAMLAERAKGGGR